MSNLLISKQYLESIVKGEPLLSGGCVYPCATSVKVFTSYRLNYDNEYEDKEDVPTLHFYVNKNDLYYYQENEKTINSHFQNATDIVWNNICKLLD